MISTRRTLTVRMLGVVVIAAIALGLLAFSVDVFLFLATRDDY